MTTKTQPSQLRRILITGGRAPVALEWCRLLHAAGHTIYIADSFPAPLCRYSNTVSRSYTVPAPRQQPDVFIEALAEIVRQERIDLLLPTCEEIFHIAGGLERLSQHVRVIAPPLAQLQRLHHKADFIELVRAAGLMVPETTLLENAQQWTQTQQHASQNGLAIVLKPVYSRFAAHVSLPPHAQDEWNGVRAVAMELDDVTPTPTKSAATANFSRANDAAPNSLTAPVPKTLSPQQPWVAQRFIVGEQLCTYSIVHAGVVVAHATYRCRYRNSRAGASVHFEALERSDTLAWVQALVSSWREHEVEYASSCSQAHTQMNDAAASGHAAEQYRCYRSSSLAAPSFAHFSGQLSFDLIEQQQTGKLYPLECNPRATSGVHLFRPQDGLEQALLNPARLVKRGIIIQPQPGTQVMLTVPMLMSGIGRRWSRAQWREWRQAFRSARDAVYRYDDPLPAYGQLRLLVAAWRISRKQRLSIVEALTYDIEWNG